MVECGPTLAWIEDDIRLLSEHEDAFGAFRFMSRAMHQQPIRTIFVAGKKAAAAAAEITFQPFADVARSVHDDLETIRASPLIRPDTPVTGFVYDVRTGRMSPVE